MRPAPQVVGAFPAALAGGFARPSPPSRGGAASPAIEAALVDLERAVRRDRSHAIVAARPGPGGTLLLRALRERLSGALQPVQVPAATLREDEICAWILGQLRQEPGGDAGARLLELAHELASRDSALVLLIGDAGSVQAETLGRLGELAAASRSALRLVLIVAIEAGAEREAVAEVVTALGVGAQKIVLHTRVEPGRTGSCTETPLERGGLEPGMAPLAGAPAPGTGGPERVAAGAARRSRSPGKARRRAYRLGAARGLLAVTAAMAIALALVGGSLRSPPVAPREAVPESIAEPKQPPPSPLPAPSAPAPSRAQPERRGSDPGLRPAGAARSEPETRPAGGVRPASATSPHPILVSLNASPWARIEVDGREVGITPLANLPLAPGPHRFRAHLPDGRVIERTLRVDAHRDHIRFP